MSKTEMKRTEGFTLIEILIALAVFIITLAGGVVVWEKRVSPMPTPTPTIIIPTPRAKTSPIPTEQTKMPWEDSVCGNGVCEPCENECCNYPCVTDTISGQLMCPPPTCLGYCPQDCQDTIRYPNPCPAGQAPVYEGGIFSNCVELTPSPKQEFRFSTEYSCNSDSDCVLKDRPYCCGEKLEYYKWCYPKSVEPEVVSCKGVGSCPGLVGSAKSCVCQNGKCIAIF